jgi:hypothetical protein
MPKAYRGALAPSRKIVLTPFCPQQVICAIVSGLALDTGQARHLCLVAIAGYWPLVLIILIRRPKSPKPTDLNAIRYGFPIVYLLVLVLGPIVWSRVGRW